MWELIIKIWEVNWEMLLVGTGVLIVLLAFYFLSRAKAVPPLVQGFVDYVNLKPESNTNIGLYSLVLAQFSDKRWEFLFSQRLRGQVVYFGKFSSGGRNYYLFMKSEEVQPMIVTNTETNYDYSFREQINEGEMELNIWSKERYLLDSVKKSLAFRADLAELFVDDRCWYEFTDLKEVVLVTDHEFRTTKELINFYALFSHLKSKL